MKIQRVELEQMLYARERRADIQNHMLPPDSGNRAEPRNGIPGSSGGNCLVCLTMNIAGDIKRTPMTRMLFDRGVTEFNALGLDVLETRMVDDVTGSEAFWLVHGDAEQVKHLVEGVEDAFPAARLFDFDVLVREAPDAPGLNLPAGGTTGPDLPDAPIRKLSRAVSRTCLICGKPAVECARSRSHGLVAIRAATDALLEEYCAGILTEAAYSALLDELYATPKPGLVDLLSCGAHTDMDVPLFEKSAAALKPYFHDAALMGMEGSPMVELRKRGLAAEKEMFLATGGVNTHKGMVYSMGLILAGMGRVLRGHADDPVMCATDLARQDAEQRIDQSLTAPVTNGGKVLKAYGAQGATGEAVAGFPDALYCASRLRSYNETESDWKRSGSLAFCDSMARLEDTNLLHRGGPEGLRFARTEASRIAAIEDFDERIRELEVLDQEMILRNLSPGGSADMLALAFLLERWYKIYE